MNGKIYIKHKNWQESMPYRQLVCVCLKFNTLYAYANKMV